MLSESITVRRAFGAVGTIRGIVIQCLEISQFCFAGGGGGSCLFEGCIFLLGDKSLFRRQLHWFHSYSSTRSSLIQGIELQQSF